MRRELFGDRHPDIAISLNSLASLYRDLGDLQQALDFTQQALAMRRELFGDGHPLTIRTAIRVSINLMTMGRRKEAYDLVNKTMGVAQGHFREQLEALRDKLLSRPLQKGFKQPPKRAKSKKKKKRK